MEVFLEQLSVCGQPRLCYLVILCLAGQEVEKIRSQTAKHQHFHVETIPVSVQMNGNLTEVQSRQKKAWNMCGICQ